MKWNLSSESFKDFDIYLIYYDHEVDNTSDDVKINTYLLMHRLAIDGFVCFFTDNGFSGFFDNKHFGVVVFDIFKKFNDYKLIIEKDQINNLPSSLTLIKSETNLLEYSFIETNNVLQKAFVLYYYYNPDIKGKYYYFTTFLIVLLDDVVNCLTFIPVITEGLLRFRVVSEVRNELLINPGTFLTSNTFLLVEPFNCLLKVMITSDHLISLRFSDYSVISVDLKTMNHAVLCSDESLKKYAEYGKTSGSGLISSSFSMEKFYISNEPLAQIVLKKGDCSYKMNLFRYIKDKFHRERIEKFLKLGIGSITTERSVYMPTRCSLNSFFYYPYARESNSSPSFFDQFTDIDVEELTIPKLEVQIDNNFETILCTDTVGLWNPRKISPVCCKKNVLYTIIAEKDIPESLLLPIFADLSHLYTHNLFGTLKPDCRDDSIIYFKDTNDITKTILDPCFCTENIHKIYFVITHSQFYIKSHCENVPILFFTYREIAEIQTSFINELSFLIYSLFRETGYKHFTFKNYQKSNNLLFLERYQHPYILEGLNAFKLHIYIDISNGRTVYCDAYGTIFKVLEIEKSCNEETSSKFIDKDLIEQLIHVSREYSIPIMFRICFFSEHVSTDWFNNINGCLNCYDCPIHYFSLHPYNCIQASVGSNGDIFVISDEKMFPSPHNLTDILTPSLSAFVISKKLQHYKVSYYERIGDESNVLKNFCQELSNLSWLTVKPNYPYRCTSYPPAISHIICNYDSPYFYISSFEFDILF